MGVLGAVYGARASYIGEEKQEKWCDSTAHLSPGLATCEQAGTRAVAEWNWLGRMKERKVAERIQDDSSRLGSGFG